MTEPEKMKLESMDVAQEKRERLRKLFPEVFSENTVNFDQLKRALGEWVEPGKERFGLNWPGKSDCMKIIQQPSIATLKPARDESVNFDTTENIFIEGDNLEVLKLLQKSYFGTVKMIYIDPPYNTGKEFIYPDTYSETLNTYLEYTGQKDSEGRKFSTNTDASGRYHSNWLNMMYPRLYLAKNLLRDDGVIFISIDDHEQANLKELCDIVFGEENFINTFCWINNLKGRQISDAGAAKTYEYILCYANDIENIDVFNHSIDILKRKMPDVYKIADYDVHSDELGEFVIKNELHNTNISEFNEITRPNLVFTIHYNFSTKKVKFSNVNEDVNFDGYVKISPKVNKMTKMRHVWRWGQDKISKELHDLRFEIQDDKSVKIYTKIRDYKSTTIKDLVMGLTSNGNNEIKKLFSGKSLFSYPKPTDLLKLFVCLSNKDDIILDFFAGSATTAHAVMQLNAEDGGKRTYICVQLPEPVDEKSEAFTEGYQTIADIAKERIRRASGKIAEEQNGTLDLNEHGAPDLGFKVFKLAPSNFKLWEGDVEKIENLEQQLFEHVDHVNNSSSTEDILYELLLKSGFPLTTHVQKLSLAGKEVFSIAEGALLICLDKELTQEVIDAIADADPVQVICLDEGFKDNDQLKANAVQTFKARAQREESEIVFRTV